MRDRWESEVIQFVRDRKIFGNWASHPAQWGFRCVRCGTGEFYGFDAYIPMCEGCKQSVEKIEKQAESGSVSLMDFFRKKS